MVLLLIPFGSRINDTPFAFASSDVSAVLMSIALVISGRSSVSTVGGPESSGVEGVLIVVAAGDALVLCVAEMPGGTGIAPAPTAGLAPRAP